MHNIFRIQSHDCIMCGFICIAFIKDMLKKLLQKEWKDYI